MKRWLPILAFVVLIFALTSQAAFTFVNYSGTYNMITEKGTFPYSMYFQDGNKIRVEMKLPEGQSISIMRMDKQVIWILLPAQSMYMEQQLTQDQVEKYQPGTNFMSKAKKVGQEKVLGYNCDIYQYVEGKTTSLSSIAVGKGILLKSKVTSPKGNVTIEATAIKEGIQPASLFELPAGYKKFSMKLPNFNK